MNPVLIILVILAYFAILMGVAHWTSAKGANEQFFSGSHESPWYVVAFGMVGVMLSGLTFASVPGTVATKQFSYFQICLGNAIGYILIAFVLLPLYYRLNLTSIYSYLGQRLGLSSERTASGFFLISRIIGASLRLFLSLKIMQYLVLDNLKIPFFVTVLISLVMIWLYTNKGGIGSIIWTDTLQTACMLIAVLVSCVAIISNLDWSVGEALTRVMESPHSQIFFTEDVQQASYFWKSFIGGIVIALVMNGLDQDIMQKNLSCKSLKEARWNMLSMSPVLLVVNFLFLCFGVLLIFYIEKNGLVLAEGDKVFAVVAGEGHLGTFTAIAFILGLTAATSSSADSALTALTTAFCIDFCPWNQWSEEEQKRRRQWVHICLSAILFIVILGFSFTEGEGVVWLVFKAAMLTYGPLLGLFAFALLTKRQTQEKWVPYLMVLSVVLIYLLNHFSAKLLGGYKFGFELLLVNGMLCFTCLWLFSTKVPAKLQSD